MVPKKKLYWPDTEPSLPPVQSQGANLQDGEDGLVNTGSGDLKYYDELWSSKVQEPSSTLAQEAMDTESSFWVSSLVVNPSHFQVVHGVFDRPSGGGVFDRPSGGGVFDRPSGRVFDRPSGGRVFDRPGPDHQCGFVRSGFVMNDYNWPSLQESLNDWLAEQSDPVPSSSGLSGQPASSSGLSGQPASSSGLRGLPSSSGLRGLPSSSGLRDMPSSVGGKDLTQAGELSESKNDQANQSVLSDDPSVAGSSRLPSLVADSNQVPWFHPEADADNVYPAMTCPSVKLSPQPCPQAFMNLPRDFFLPRSMDISGKMFSEQHVLENASEFFSEHGEPCKVSWKSYRAMVDPSERTILNVPLAAVPLAAFVQCGPGLAKALPRSGASNSDQGNVCVHQNVPDSEVSLIQVGHGFPHIPLLPRFQTVLSDDGSNSKHDDSSQEMTPRSNFSDLMSDDRNFDELNELIRVQTWSRGVNVSWTGNVLQLNDATTQRQATSPGQTESH